MKNVLLLINLGTPRAPNKRSVWRYLREFLSDPRVIDIPTLLRYCLLYGIILPFRTKSTTRAYQAIWTDDGSPLLVNSLKLKEKLQIRLPHTSIVLGMRYGSPSIQAALQGISSCESICVLPLYPQYSNAATGSAIAKVLTLLASHRQIPSLKIISNFYQHPAYIKAQAELIRPILPTVDYILFSYHGVPIQHIRNAGCRNVCDGPCLFKNEETFRCYKAQCYHSTAAIVSQLGILPEQHGVSFQSRLGKAAWLTPFTDFTLHELAKKGIKRLAICCPSFVADCLETKEEIGIRAKQQWQQLTGETLTLVPCLNDHDAWVDAIIDIAEY